MKVFKSLTVLLASLSLTLGLTACGTKDSDSIKIGVHFELSGEVADYGNKEKNGVMLAIKQANEKAGSEKYTTVTYDNKGNPDEAVRLASQLVSDGVIGVVGPATSGASLATYQVSNDGKVIVVSPSATQTGVTLDSTGKAYDYAFRVCFEDSFQGAAMAQYAYDKLGKSKAIIYSDSSTDYANGLSKAFSEQFTKLGGSIVDSVSYVAKETDFNSVLTSIKDKDFDVLFIPGYYQEVGLIIKQAREMGITQTIVGGDGFDSSDLSSLAGNSNLNDVYFTTAYSTVGASDKLKAFVDAYKAEYGEDPNMFSALAYDATNVLIQAIEEANSNDSAKVREALEKIKFEGVTGAFSFDDTHTPIKSVLVVKLVDGVQSDAEYVSPKLD